MSKLDPRIEAVRAAYDLAAGDFWQIPQNKQWVCKHAALEIVATKAGVLWSAPQIIEANGANGIAAMAVTGVLGDRTEWATGEASPKNNKNSYPWAMAEKRAKDRVILKLVGIHGLVYSEDEIGEPAPQQNQPSQDQTKPTSAAEMKRGLASIDKDLLDCASIVTVNTCAETWQHVAKRDGWTKDYMTEAAKKFQARRDQITAAENEPANDDTEHQMAGE